MLMGVRTAFGAQRKRMNTLRVYILVGWVHEYRTDIPIREQPGRQAAEAISTEEQVRAFDLLAGLPDDLEIVGREKDRPQKHKGL